MFVAGLIVAAILGHATPTVCDYTADQHGGRYDYPTQTVHLQPLVCAWLSRWTPDRELAAALFIVAHEAEHARGIVDEHGADCAALPWVPRLAVRFLGVTAARAGRLGAAALALHLAQPAPYSGPC